MTIAKQVANACWQSHADIVLGDGFIEDFPRCLEQGVLRSSGYLGLSGAASYYVNSSARNIAPIRLTGNYGSELFRGVRTFKSQMPSFRFYDPSLRPFLKDGESRFAALGASDPITFSLFHQAPSQGFGLLAVEDTQVVMRTPFLDNDLVKLVYQGPRSYAAGADLSISIIERNNPVLLGIMTDFGYLGTGSRLTKAARRMYFQSLFKAEYFSSRGMPQWATGFFHYAQWLSPHKFFRGRHKYQHFQNWLKDELSPYVKDVLINDSRSPSCLDKAALKEMVRGHLNGEKNYLYEIDKAMTISLCARLFLSP